MDKKMLRAIPAETADNELFRMSKFVGGFVRYIVTADIQNEILILHFFSAEDLRAGIDTATFRTFHTLDDYISQDLKSTKTKWLTAGFENMDWDFGPMRYSWAGGWSDQTTFRSLDERDLVCDYFGSQVWDDDRFKPWSAIFRLQSEIRERRIQERHDKELAPTDELMATIDDAPQEFFDWVWNTGMEFAQYLIYKDAGKGEAECECLVCRQTGKVKRSEIRMRNNENGTCPFCGAKVTFKAKGRMPWKIDDSRYFDYVEPTADGFIFRIFYAWRRTLRADGPLPASVDQDIMEVRRAFYTFRLNDLLDLIPSYEPYEWGVYKQHGDSRWCPNNEHQPCWSNVLYPGNLPEAWEHTPMKYSALEIFSKNRPNIEMRNEDMINFYCRHPKLEWLIKMGLYRLARDAPYGDLDLNRETIYDILELGKMNTKVLQAVDGGTDILKLLRKIEEIGLYVTPESLMEYYMVFDDDERALLPENRRATIHKICRYIRSEAKSYKPQEGCRYWSAPISAEERKIYNTALDWLDYIEWCKRLGYDISNRSIYLPKNFRAVHDRTLEDFKAMEDRIKAEERRQLNEAVRRVLKDESSTIEKILSGQKTGRLQSNELILVVPTDGEEIRAEGEALHDCLQTYIKKVAEGQTHIFFIRKADEPFTPYFAMEYRDGKVIQVRGKNNYSAPKKVQDFAEAFAEIIKEKVKAG